MKEGKIIRFGQFWMVWFRREKKDQNTSRGTEVDLLLAPLPTERRERQNDFTFSLPKL
jgi:hypothetical protein